MTREEQIKEAAKQYCEKFPRGKTASFVSFRAVVEWNEQNQSSVDWQQVRIQAAIAAMQGILSNSDYVRSVEHISRNTGEFRERVSTISTEQADALVERLKEE